MEVDVRCSPEGIDAPFLTATLARAGVARGATVTAVEFAGYIGTGQTGRNGRFLLSWDDPAGRPASVVAKFASDDPHASTTAFASGSYFREWQFYTEVVDSLQVRTPAVYATRYDADAQEFLLLMEDIAGSQQGDQIAGLTADEAALAVSEAVKFHSPLWGDPSLDARFSGGLSVEERAAGITMVYGATLDGFLKRLGHRLDDDVIALVHDLAPLVGNWVLRSTAPRTIVHMDYRPDNLLFGRSAGAPPIVIVDWQTFGAGPAMTDIAYLLGGAFEPGRRAEVERELVELHRRGLTDAGISYGADECWRDYRLGSIWGVAMTVIATMYAEETERGNDMLTAMGNRHGRHVLDLDALSLLR